MSPKIIEAQLEEHKTGIRVLSGPIKPPGAADAISVAQADAIIRHLAAVSDYLLLDLGVGLDEANRHSLSMCHHIVVTVEPQRVALTLAQSLLGEMTGTLNLPSHKISVAVVNKAAGRRHVYQGHSQGTAATRNLRHCHARPGAGLASGRAGDTDDSDAAG